MPIISFGRFSAITIMIFAVMFAGNAQTNLDRGPRIEIPTSAGLYKYVTYPVSNFTGIPDIKIPLHQFNISGIEFPISISYHGAGHKVNDVASWIGLGWGLQAGGAISRSTVGIPDESPGSGIFSNPVKDGSQIGATAGDFLYLEEILDRKTDAEPDVFYYNFMGKSGKFAFNSQKEILQQPYTDLKIEFINNLFKITDEAGNQFFFNDVAETLSYNSTDGRHFESATNWHLTKIITADKKDIVELTYLKDGGETIQTIDYVMQVGNLRRVIGMFHGRQSDAGIENEPIYTVYYDRPGYCFLSRISFSNGSIDFKSSRNRSDLGLRTLDSVIVRSNSQIIKTIALEHSYFVNDVGYNLHLGNKYRLKLNALQVTGSDQTIAPQRYAFGYEENYKLPPRNNCGMDWWGYSNGKVNNRSLVPLPEIGSNYEFTDLYGLKTVTNISSELGDRRPDENHMKAYQLKRIVYPTKGYTDFEFEPNKRITTIKQETVNTLAYLIATKEDSPPTQIDFVPAVGVTSATLTMNIPLWHDIKQPYIEVWNMTKTRHERFTAYPGEQTFRSVTLSLIPGDQYRVIANIKKNPQDPEDDIDQRVIANIFHTVISDVSSTELGPGLRIRTIKSYTGSNVLATTEEYKYGRNESGVGEPRFFDYIFTRKSYEQKFHFAYAPDVPNNIPATSFSANALMVLSRPIFDYFGEGYTFAYPYVTKYSIDVANGKNQKSVYEYEFQVDEQYAPGIPEVVSLVSSFWKSGQLKSETLFSLKDNGSYDTLRRTLNNYYDEMSLRESLGLRVRKNEIPKGTSMPTRIIENYFTFFHYPAISGLKKLRSTQETSYINGRADVRTLREYDYQGNLNLQPRLISSSLSTGITETAYLTYPQDYIAGTVFIDKMRNNNIIKYPIERVRYKGTGTSALLSTGALTIFDSEGRGIADKEYSWMSRAPVALSGFKFSNRVLGTLPDSPNKGAFAMDSRYLIVSSILSKDQYGNPTEIKKLIEPSTVYLWGYGGKYPIAEIRNATYVEVEAVLTKATIDNLNLPTVNLATITAAMDKLRTDTRLSKSMITGYTYQPLVGMRSKTDARGVTEFYEYDGMQRLKAVLDQVKNVTTSMDYHYRSN